MIESRLLLRHGDVVEQYGNSQSLKDLSHEFQHGRVVTIRIPLTKTGPK